MRILTLRPLYQRQRGRRTSTPPGFSLVEVLVAVTILGLIAAAVARTAVVLMQENRVAVAQLTQSQATRRQAEAYRAIPFDSLDPAGSPYRFPVNGDGEIEGPGARDTLVVFIEVNPTRPTYKRIQTLIIRH